MPYELSRRYNRLARADEAQDYRELAAIGHLTELAEHKVSGINRVTQRAIFETMITAVMRQKAEQIAPDGAEVYAMLFMAGGVQCTQVIGSMYQPRRRGSL